MFSPFNNSSASQIFVTNWQEYIGRTARQGVLHA